MARSTGCIHICSVYDSPAEQLAALLPFIETGIRKSERCICILHDRTRDEFLEALAERRIDGQRLLNVGQLVLPSKEDTYLRQRPFDPNATVQGMWRLVRGAHEAGFSGCRITADMSWALDMKCEELIEYERLCNTGSDALNVTGLCQYDRRRFTPAIIKDILRTHPWVILQKRTYANFYYEPPTIFSQNQQSEEYVQLMLTNIRRRRGTSANQEDA